MATFHLEEPSCQPHHTLAQHKVVVWERVLAFWEGVFAVLERILAVLEQLLVERVLVGGANFGAFEASCGGLPVRSDQPCAPHQHLLLLRRVLGPRPSDGAERYRTHRGGVSRPLSSWARAPLFES